MVRPKKITVKNSSKNRLDLLTDDLFIGEILSCVNTIESIVRLSLVSKKLQKLCWYTPVVDIRKITYSKFNYLNQFFAFRTNSKIKSEFQRFCFRLPEIKYTTMDIPTLSFVKEHLLRWFQDALSLNVQELILQVQKRTITYHCHKLPYLKFDSYPLTHLRVLTLQNIPIGFKRSFEYWVSTCCVNLEELHLTGVFVFPSELRITSSSLRFFTIEAHFRHLYVSAPKLVTLHVKWDLINYWRDEPNLSLRISYAPNLEDFKLANWDTRISVEHFSSDNQRNFPSLQSASIEFPGIVNIPDLDSFRRLLLDVSQTRNLNVTENILRKISHNGITHLATLFHKLEELHVGVDVSGNHNLEWAQSRTRTVMSFVKMVRPSLKTLKLTKDDWYDFQNHYSNRESLVEDILRFGISSPAVYVDGDTIKVELSSGEDETLLVPHIIKDAPKDMEFIISYPLLTSQH